MERLALLVNTRTLIVVGLAVLSTWLCIRFDFTADFPMTLIGTAVIFPVVFSINSAYQRRESVLADYAAIKGYMRAIYLGNARSDGDRGAMLHIKSLFQAWLKSFVKLVTSPLSEIHNNEAAVYKEFRELSDYLKSLYSEGAEGAWSSRSNRHIAEIMRCFESIKHVYVYRTPLTLKAFGDVFIVLLPPIYGPHFAQLAQEYSQGLAFVMPITFAVILTALSNIQDQLENPFDGYGEDDVKFGIDEFLASLDESG